MKNQKPKNHPKKTTKKKHKKKTNKAQKTGAPAILQTKKNKPGMIYMEKGSMKKEGMSGTSGMSSDNKGKPNKEMSKDGSPAAGSKDMMKK